MQRFRVVARVLIHTVSIFSAMRTLSILTARRQRKQDEETENEGKHSPNPDERNVPSERIENRVDAIDTD